MAEDKDNLYGDGKIGKRLWVRTPDNRWARPPFGAGIDPYLRSLNVWDDKKKQWWTPSWPEASYSYSALNVRVDDQGRIWDNRSGDNPVEDIGLNHDKYIKFFYVAPRTNENWRIVNLTTSIPTTNPSLSIPRFYKNFGPRGAFLSKSRIDYYYGRPPEEGTGFDYVGVYDSDSGGGGGFTYEGYPVVAVGTTDVALTNSSYIKQAEPPTGPSFFPSMSMLRGGVAGMLDLASIRDHLQFEFPQSNFYVGQYADLSQMRVARVFLAGPAIFTAQHYAYDNTFIYGLPDVPGVFDTCRFQLYYNTNVAGIELPMWPYLPRFPDSTTPNGTRFINATGVPGPTVYSGTGTEPRRAIRTGGRYVQLNIIEPGEDNITFYSAASTGDAATNSTTAMHSVGSTFPGQPGTPVAAPYPFGISASCAFQPTFIQIHYARPGYDTPADTHEMDTGLGDIGLG